MESEIGLPDRVQLAQCYGTEFAGKLTCTEGIFHPWQLDVLAE